MNKFLIGIGACLLLISPLLSAGDWVEDPITGCSIWNDEPANGSDVVSWSGECTEGKASGHGVLVWLAEGELLVRYVGVLKAGKVDGIGELIVRAETFDGYDHYTAEFVNGAGPATTALRTGGTTPAGSFRQCQPSVFFCRFELNHKDWASHRQP